MNQALFLVMAEENVPTHRGCVFSLFSSGYTDVIWMNGNIIF